MKKVKIKDFPTLIKDTYMQWLDDKSLKLAASLSFYSILSMVPFLVIVISIVGFFLGQETANQTIVEQVGELIGVEGAELFKTLAEYSFFKESGLVPTIISGTILIAGALGVFIELKESLNIIWGIEIKPGNSLKLFF
ncbi:MAG: YihY/virulence factor BrkB family protein [Ignavibacteriales bacterium]|nr:YihY/virulence factor BrkB family protein [Ignavibacteriales bacterium]